MVDVFLHGSEGLAVSGNAHYCKNTKTIWKTKYSPAIFATIFVSSLLLLSVLGLVALRFLATFAVA
jgi:hypothetical protein